MRSLTKTIIIPLVLLCSAIKGQMVWYNNHSSFTRDTSKFIYIKDTTGFKTIHPELILTGEKWSCKSRTYIYTGISKEAQAGTVNKPLLTIHGNIYYDVYYQSNIDTPYFTKDLYQHTIRTYLDVKVKDNYPLRVGFSTRFSNSSLLRNITGLNLQFNSQEFKNTIRNKLINWLTAQASKKDQLEKIKNLIGEKQKQLASLKSTVAEPSQSQKIIEQNEQEWLAKNRPGNSNTSANNKHVFTSPAAQLKDSLINRLQYGIAKKNNDSLANKTLSKYEAIKRQCDSLLQQIQVLQQSYNTLDKEATANLPQLINKVRSAGSMQVLNSTITELQVPDSVLPKGYKTLLGIKSFGIGKTVVDYSELSAKNISITGIQAEYNPADYYAIASGYIDYRYRDFIVNDAYRPKQYLNIVRFGKAVKEGNSIIFTYYAGKKQLYNYATSSISTTQPDYRIMGITLEGKYKVNSNTFLSAEIAKSSLPYYNRSLKGQTIAGSTIDFENRSNEAEVFLYLV